MNISLSAFPGKINRSIAYRPTSGLHKNLPGIFLFVGSLESVPPFLFCFSFVCFCRFRFYFSTLVRALFFPSSRAAVRLLLLALLDGYGTRHNSSAPRINCILFVILPSLHTQGTDILTREWTQRTRQGMK